MKHKQRIPRRGGALVAVLVFALAPATTLAAVARVDFAIGNVQDVDAQGRVRPITHGAHVYQGDTIHTNRGRAQLRFSDGTYTSLQPETEFRIDDYKFKGQDSSAAKGFFSLLKGGLRTITGLIGKLRHANYRLTTPSATIGIRGTEFLAVVRDGLEVTVGEGSIEVCNHGGCTTFTNGESGYVADDNTKPIYTDEKPEAPPADPTGGLTYSSDEDVTSDGSADVVGTRLSPLQPSPVQQSTRFADGPYYALAVALGYDSCGDGCVAVTTFSVPGSGSTTLATATFDPTGTAVLSYSGSFGESQGDWNFSSGTVDASATQVTDAGGDGIVGWGRWTTGTLTQMSGGSSNNIDIYPTYSCPSYTCPSTHHYAVGLPTAQLPTGSATYTLLGATHPTFYDGTGQGVLNSASLAANFDSGSVSVNLNLTMQPGTANAETYDVSSLPATMGSGANRYAFSGSSSSVTVSGPTSACLEFGCDAYVNGFFAGTQAERAGLTYAIRDNYDAYSSIVGAAAFTKSSPSTPPGAAAP